MGKDYRDEKNREKRFRGQKPDHPKKDDFKKKKGGHHGQKFHENFDDDEPFGGPSLDDLDGN